MFKKIFFGLLLFAVLAFGGLTYYISTLDWNAYKKDIADKFSELTGKDIDLGGKINISLLPQPMMTAENISVYNQGQTKKPLATIKKMETSMSLLSLLQGTPDITSFSMSGAEIWVEQYENGKTNWSSSEEETKASVGKNTNLHNLNLQDATFHYVNKAADFKLDLNKINAEVQAVAFDGPYRLDGNFIKGDDHFAIAVGIGSFASIDGIETNFSISHPASESYLRFDGVYNPQEHNIKGDFSGGSKKTAEFVNTLSQMNLLNPENEQELQFSTGVEADASLIKLSSFVIKYSDDIEGSGSVTYPLVVAENAKRQIDVKYEFLNVNIRHFITALKTEYEKYKTDGGEYYPNTNFNITADLASKRVDFSDNDLGYLENVTLKANWTDNIFSIEEFYASCAGETSLSVSGDLREENMKPHYFLKNSVISTDFLSFANALGINLQSYVQSSYHNARFDFSVVGDEYGFNVENAELSMDKIKVNADFSTSFLAETPNFTLKAEADNFNFDNYLPTDEEHRTFLEQLKNDTENTEFLKNIDFDIDFTATNAVFRSTPITALVVKVKNQKGLLTIDEFSAQNIAGAALKILGTFNLQGKEFTFRDAEVNIQTSNIADLISQTNFELPAWKIFKTKTFKLASNISGNLNEVETKSNIAADGASIDYDGKISLGEKTDFTGKFGVKTTNTGQLLDGLGFDTKNLPNKNGALNCEGNLNYNTGNFKYQEAKCMIGSANYNGDFEVSEADEKYDIKAKINSDEFNLSYLFEFNPSKTANFGPEAVFDNTFISRPDLSRDVLNLNKYKNADLNMEITAQKAVLKRLAFGNLHFKLNNKDNALKLEEIDANYKNAHYTGDLTLFYANPDNPELKGNFRFSDVDIGLIGGNTYAFNDGKITGTTAFESKGTSVYEMFTNMSGYVSMTVTDLNFKGIDLATINEDISSRKYSKGLFQAIRDNLQRGETDFEPFDVTIAMKNGVLTVGNLNLVNQFAKSDVNFEIDLKEWKINSKMVVYLTDAGDVPSFYFSLNGMLQKPSLEINIENMVKHYDEHWKQAEEKEQAEKDAARKELNEKMEIEQRSVESISSKVNFYVPIIEKYKEKSTNADNIAWYDKKLEQIAQVNKDIDEMKSKAHTPDFTAEDIAKIKEKTENYKHDIAAWRDEIHKHFAEDVDIHLNKLLNDKSNVDMGLQKLKSDYESLFNQKTEALSKVKEQEKLFADQDFQTKKASFDALCQEVTDLSSELDKQLLPINTIINVNQKDSQVSGLDGLAENLNNKYEQAEAAQKDLVDFLNKFSADLLKKHDKKQEAEEQEEAASTDILKAKTGEEEQSNISERRDGVLKEISDTQGIIENLADEEPKAQGVIIRSYDDKSTNSAPAKTNSGLLRDVDGAIKKASGTITVK